MSLTLGFANSTVHAKSKKRRAPTKPTLQKTPPIEMAELKVLLQESSIESFLNWIKTVDADFEQKHIFFFDTANLDLDKQGVVLRVRRMQDDTFDTTVKLRSDTIEELPSVSTKSGKLECELDVYVGGPRQNACRVTQKSKKVLPSVDSESVTTYFNPGQTQFAKFKFPDIKWKELKTFGRVIATEWKTKFDNKDVTFELWTLPSKKRFIEASTRVAIKDIDTTQTALIEFLKSKKFEVVDAQKYKTNLVLTELK